MKTTRRVYFFTEAKWALEDIIKQRLKVCRFFDLNDPFELLAAEQGDMAFRRKLRDWAKTLNEKDGLLCFSESWRNPLMWSHYGDRHKGICLGFDVAERILQPPINYSPKRLTSAQWNGVNLADPPNGLREALLTTKFERWKYEKERRVILPLKGLVQDGQLFFKKFDCDLKLAEVIAGPRCCVKWKRPLETAIEDLPARPRLIKARLAFKQFKVVTQKLENSVELGFEAEGLWQKCVCLEPHF